MTSAQPQSISLSEAEIKETCDHTAKTKRLLLHAFYNASAEQKSDLEPNLKDLQDLLTLYEVISDVRKGLNKTKSTWVPRGHIAEIVRACCNQRYEEHDIESIFYKHGGINGLLVLHLGAKDHTPVYSKICALSIEMIAELAKQCGKEKINGAVPGWIDDYNRSRTEFDPTDYLPRLYRYAVTKQKRKRARSTTSTSPVKLPDGIPQTDMQPFKKPPPPLNTQSSTEIQLPSRVLPGPEALQQGEDSTIFNDSEHFGASSDMLPISADDFSGWGWLSSELNPT